MGGAAAQSDGLTFLDALSLRIVLMRGVFQMCKQQCGAEMKNSILFFLEMLTTHKFTIAAKDVITTISSLITIIMLLHALKML
jgi:hypothetical protein